MKAENPVCAVRRIAARKGHDVAEWIAVQHWGKFHLKQEGVWVTLYINTSQGVIMQGIPISQMQILSFSRNSENFRTKEGPKDRSLLCAQLSSLNCFAKNS